MRQYTQDESDKMRQKLEDIQTMFTKSDVSLPALDSLLAELKSGDSKVATNPLHARLTTSEYAAIHAINKRFRG